MPLSANRKLGPYEILAPVGEGGMGEVYRARDTRLNRFVAIKVLPQAIADDPGRMARFEQEARSIAALNHPNIVAIYDVGVQNGTSYLVMELLEGETLRERLERGALPVRKAVEIGTQIAYGLAAAHERGIVHRDLKPENIFLTKDGHVKLLDFGLAKDQSVAANGSSGSGATVTMRTAPGVVMGTAPYMAPEQVRGELMDYRADVFSFGAVLYEMLSGKRAFSGDSPVETMNAILKSEPPDIDPAGARISPGLDRIVRHCLEKNPADRFQSARDLTFALGALTGSGSTSALPAISTARPHNRWIWAIVAVALIAAALAGFIASRSGPAVQRMDFAIATDDEVTHLALSPDGSMLAYVSPDENTGESLVHVQRVGSTEARHLDGSEGATYPFWSPDAKYVAFFANGKLKKMSISGRAPEVIAKADGGRGGTWGKKNVIVYAPSPAGPLWKVNPDGTDAAPLTDKLLADKEASHRWPVFLPDGDHFIFWAGDFDQGPNDRHTGIYLSSLGAKQKDLVTPALSSCGYGQGRLYYVDDKHSLVSVRMGESNATLLDRPRVVAAHVGRNPSTYWGAFAVADNGTVVYHLASGTTLSQLTWYNRDGQELAKVGDMSIMANPKLSPDAQRVAVDVADLKDRNVDVWIRDLPGNAYTRFTFDPAEETNAVWSHDGKNIAYRSAASGGCIIRLKNANGLEAERGVGRGRGVVDQMPTSWTRDDTGIVITQQTPATGSKLLLLSVADGKETPVVNASGSQYGGQISPDGKWLAYASDESGDWDVYITPFPATGGKLQVSRGGGTEPRWRGDGKEIFYLSPTKQIMSVTVTAAGGLSTGPPTLLFQIHARAPVSSTDIFSYDVTADGQRFLVNQYVKPAQVLPLNIVLNSTAGMQ
jgi:eukaryotic-like serine/threonine-protein kinase